MKFYSHFNRAIGEFQWINSFITYNVYDFEDVSGIISFSYPHETLA
jgi:hypothetical protein